VSFPLEEMLSKDSITVTKRGLTSFRSARKEVGTNAVEVCAGAEPISERARLVIMSEDIIYIGSVGVTPENGFVVLGGYENRFTIDFDPRSPVSVYAIAEEPTHIRIWEEA